MIILVAAILLILLILIYGGRKMWKSGKNENKSIDEAFDKEKRIKELKANLKKHEKEIKKLSK